jgi:hypothetical protein
MTPPPTVLATGQALAARLSELIPRLVGGEIPKCAGQWIAWGVIKCEEKLHRQARAGAILAILDPEQCESIGHCAELIEDHLKRLHRAMVNILSGKREATELELLLMAWIDAGGPQSARRIRDALIEALRK